jgi:nitrogen fixation protein FixH
MKGRLWIGIVVGLLTMTVAMQVLLLVVATTDPSFAVEPDYEARAARWNEVQRQEATNRRLGWTVDLETTPAATPGMAAVRVSLFDTWGKPLRDATVEIETFHAARAANVVKATLPGDGEGAYVATLPLRPSGLWEFRLTARSGDDLFTARIRKSVLTTPGGRHVR